MIHLVMYSAALTPSLSINATKASSNSTSQRVSRVDSLRKRAFLLCLKEKAHKLQAQKDVKEVAFRLSETSNDACRPLRCTLLSKKISCVNLNNYFWYTIEKCTSLFSNNETRVSLKIADAICLKKHL